MRVKKREIWIKRSPNKREVSGPLLEREDNEAMPLMQAIMIESTGALKDVCCTQPNTHREGEVGV